MENAVETSGKEKLEKIVDNKQLQEEKECRGRKRKLSKEEKKNAKVWKYKRVFVRPNSSTF